MYLYFAETKNLLEAEMKNSEIMNVWLQALYIRLCFSCYMDLHRKECSMKWKEKIQFIETTKKSPIHKYSLSDNNKLKGKRKIFKGFFVLIHQ